MQFNVSPREAGFSEQRLARVDSLLTHYVQNGLMPNAVTLVARQGKVVHFKAYGYKDIESQELLETSDIFRIASQTKAITSVALMILYEQGRLMLDEPVSKYIPEFKNPQVLLTLNPKDTTYTTRAAKREITIRHLLAHTSGLPYTNEITKKAGIPVINSLDSTTIGQQVQKLAHLPLLHDPGEQFTYGLNTDVIGYLIEVISGVRLDSFMSQHIFMPLGMNDTYFNLPANKANRLVTLYSKDSLNGPIYKSTNVANQTFPVAGAGMYLSGGAGLSGSIADYAVFCQMLLNGGTYNGKCILSRKTVELMTRNQIDNLTVGNYGNKFGLGFEIVSQQGASAMPSSVGQYGWGGAYCTDYKIDPAEDLIVLIYTNVLPYANPDINNRFRAMIYQALK